MFLPLLIVIGLVVYLLWDKKGKFSVGDHRKDEAIELLKRRYINGEIDEDTYEKIKRTISE